MTSVYIDNTTAGCRYDTLDIVHEPQQICLPIYKDTINSVISLEDAVKPLVEFMPKIRRKVQQAKQNCQNPSDGLSCDESAAIYLFSMRWKPDDECLYFILNTILRSHDVEKLKPWNLYLKLLFAALNRLPSNEITFYQDIKQDLIKYKNLKENFIVLRDFTFCSLSIPLSQKSTKNRTILEFKCHNAKFIERHIFNSDKNEIILMPTQFQFAKYVDRRSDLDIIQFEEYSKSSPLITLPITFKQIRESITSMKKFTSTVTPMNTLSDTFYHNSKLERQIASHLLRSQMNLTYQNLTVNDVPIIIKQAIIDKQCTKLLLDNNSLNVEFISNLVLVLPNNTTLQELHLFGSNIDDKCVQILAQALAFNNSSLTLLGLNKNSITDIGAQYLAEMFNTNTILTCLQVLSNPIRKKGIKLLLNALHDPRNNLQQLVFSKWSSINFERIFKSICHLET
ncbi:unnamed protein product [Adineta steineri]|uniref:Uncharacterized protein n=1 Tax=Adineta steineri TaxID=433720 RepID=A0A814CYL9_9BILA|nr:unnamed protein product [Adineta steineri]CAF3974093.1 unnamed protein product [Adineta steineri]